VHGYGAVAPLTGRTPYHSGHVLGKGEFAIFLRHLLRYYRDKRLLVIHDRGAQHKGPPVEAVLKDATGRLMLTPQPVYSPELHPEERLWKWLRRVVTHTHWFDTLHEEIHAMRDFFCYLAGRKEEVRRLCAIKIPESLLALL
jgi:transposase